MAVECEETKQGVVVAVFVFCNEVFGEHMFPAYLRQREIGVGQEILVECHVVVDKLVARDTRHADTFPVPFHCEGVGD